MATVPQYFNNYLYRKKRSATTEPQTANNDTDQETSEIRVYDYYNSHTLNPEPINVDESHDSLPYFHSKPNRKKYNNNKNDKKSSRKPLRQYTEVEDLANDEYFFKQLTPKKFRDHKELRDDVELIDTGLVQPMKEVESKIGTVEDEIELLHKSIENEKNRRDQRLHALQNEKEDRSEFDSGAKHSEPTDTDDEDVDDDDAEDKDDAEDYDDEERENPDDQKTNTSQKPGEIKQYYFDDFFVEPNNEDKRPIKKSIIDENHEMMRHLERETAGPHDPKADER